MSSLPLGFETSDHRCAAEWPALQHHYRHDDNGDGHLKDRPHGRSRGTQRGRAAATYIWDLRLARPIRIVSRRGLSPRWISLTVVNHPNFDAESYIGTLSAAPAFGKPTDIISPPRQLQLGVKFIF